MMYKGVYQPEQKHHKSKTFCVYNTECSFAHRIRLELHDTCNGFSVYGPFRHKVMRSIPRTVLDNYVLFQHTQLQSMEFSREP